MTTLWRIDPLEPLLVAMPAQKKTPHIQGTFRFHAVFTRAHHQSLSWVK